MEFRTSVTSTIPFFALGELLNALKGLKEIQHKVLLSWPENTFFKKECSLKL